MAETVPTAPPGVATAEFDGPALLKSMRSVLGLSQEKFADLVGMKRQQISAYENGHHSPSLDTLMDLAAKAGLQLAVTIQRSPKR